MKLQIDTSNKIIRIEERVNLKELIDNLNKLFPKNSWYEYDLDGSPIYNWSSPIIIEEPYIQPLPWNPQGPYYGSPINCDVNNSCYNVEFKK